MIPEYEKIICVRIPARLKAEIDNFVASGRVKSASELIREAVIKFLEGVEKA